MCNSEYEIKLVQEKIVSLGEIMCRDSAAENYTANLFHFRETWFQTVHSC